MSKLSIFVDESGEWGKLSEYYLITLVLHVQSDSVAEHIDKYERHLADSGLPDISRMATDKSRWLASKALSSGRVLFVIER